MLCSLEKRRKNNEVCAYEKKMVFPFIFPAMSRYNCSFFYDFLSFFSPLRFQCVLFVFLRVNFFLRLVFFFAIFGHSHLRVKVVATRWKEEEKKLLCNRKYAMKNRSQSIAFAIFPNSKMKEWFFCFCICNFLFNSKI